MISGQDYHYSYSEGLYVALCTLRTLFYTVSMSDPAKINRVPRLLLLFCIFLAAQGLSFAHELDHHASGDSNSCVICPLGSNVEAAATDSGNPLPLTVSAATGPGRTHCLGDDAFSIENSARGPPSFF
jgi:hypothetical protein